MRTPEVEAALAHSRTENTMHDEGCTYQYIGHAQVLAAEVLRLEDACSLHEAIITACKEAQDKAEARVRELEVELKHLTTPPFDMPERVEWRPECRSFYVYGPDGVLLGNDHPVYAVVKSVRNSIAAPGNVFGRILPVAPVISTTASSSTVMQSSVEDLREQNARLRAALGLADVWPLFDVLAKLCEAVQHMRRVQERDAHGHEQWYHAADAGERLIPQIKAALAGTEGTTQHCQDCDWTFSCWATGEDCRKRPKEGATP